MSEVEKDLMRLAIRLQARLITLMFQLEKRPSPATFHEFKVAVLSTNWALSKLSEAPVSVPENYLKCNLAHTKEIKKNTDDKKNCNLTKLKKTENGKKSKREGTRTKL